MTSAPLWVSNFATMIHCWTVVFAAVCVKLLNARWCMPPLSHCIFPPKRISPAHALRETPDASLPKRKDIIMFMMSSAALWKLSFSEWSSWPCDVMMSHWVSAWHVRRGSRKKQWSCTKSSLAQWEQPDDSSSSQPMLWLSMLGTVHQAEPSKSQGHGHSRAYSYEWLQIACQPSQWLVAEAFGPTPAWHTKLLKHSSSCFMKNHSQCMFIIGPS